jgi:hypothetical protein
MVDIASDTGDGGAMDFQPLHIPFLVGGIAVAGIVVMALLRVHVLDRDWKADR